MKTYSKNPVGGKTPISLSMGLAESAELSERQDDGTNAAADAAVRIKARIRTILSCIPKILLLPWVGGITTGCFQSSILQDRRISDEDDDYNSLALRDRSAFDELDDDSSSAYGC